VVARPLGDRPIIEGAMPAAAIRRTCLAVGLAALLALAPAAAPGADQLPRLRIERWKPVAVAGAHFRPHERVRLTLNHPGGTESRRTRANERGSFVQSFADVTIDRCARYAITATGSSGSHARLFRRPLPECRPPRPLRR
jgi:hypothetical protein